MTSDAEKRKLQMREKLLTLQGAYLEEVPGRLLAIAEMWQSHRNDNNEDVFQPLYTEVHKLAGTATMYGLKDLGDIANEAEQELLTLKDSSSNKTILETDSAIHKLCNWKNVT